MGILDGILDFIFGDGDTGESHPSHIHSSSSEPHSHVDTQHFVNGEYVGKSGHSTDSGHLNWSVREQKQNLADKKKM